MAMKRRTEPSQELNLVPIMNLVTILIPVLLMAAQFVSLAVIDSTLEPGSLTYGELIIPPSARRSPWRRSPRRSR